MTGNQVIKHWTLLLLSCCILLPSLLRAEEARGRESILIISSYNPDTRRMSSFITEFERQVVASGVPCDIYIETLECKSINDAPLWISQTDNLITRYESKGGLRAIVLLGQEAWASFVSLGRIPKEVMCFSCFVSSNGIVFPPPSDSADVWMPRSINYMNMVDSLHNVGGLLNKYDIRRNIELIRTLYPEVENLAFISDNTYGGISLQALVREEMENYPDLNLVLVDSRDGDEASHAAYASLSPRSAVMLGTWRVGSDGEYLMQRSLNDLVQLNPRLPVFSITRTGIGDVAVGGFVPNYENGANVIAAQIKEYYKTGSLGGVHFHLSDGRRICLRLAQAQGAEDRRIRLAEGQRYRGYGGCQTLEIFALYRVARGRNRTVGAAADLRGVPVPAYAASQAHARRARRPAGDRPRESRGVRYAQIGLSGQYEP